jgi:hypothetical protein
MLPSINLPLWPTDDELDELDELDDEDGVSKQVSQGLGLARPGIHWREAYETNKTRETCIICGKTLIEKPVFSTIIKTCSCVDILAEKDLIEK